MTLIFLILLVTLIPLIVLLFASYLTHIWMIKDDIKYPHGYGTFIDFKKQFRSVKWKRDLIFTDSFFGASSHDENYIHASIIRFGGVDMILDPISYTIFLLWCIKNKYSTKIPRKETPWGKRNG